MGVVIFLWIWYCFDISILIHLFITSYHVDPGLQKQITSLDKLLDLKTEFGFRPEIKVYSEGMNNLIHKYLLDHKKECNQTKEYVQHITDTASFTTNAESWFVDKYLWCT